MIVDRIKFSKEFFILGAGEWVTMEAQIQENEDPCECIKELKQKMISMYGWTDRNGWEGGAGYVMSQDSYSPPLDQPPVKETRIQSIAESIKSCKEVKVLESYRLIAKSEKELQTAYDETYKKLEGKE